MSNSIPSSSSSSIMIPSIPTTSTTSTTDIINSTISSIITSNLSMPLSQPSPPTSGTSDSIYSLRLALTITHLFLVSIGSINLLVIFVILLRPYMRSITNVYMISLCLADFLYLANLTLVAATQLNGKSWPFGSFMCTAYHGTETTGKYASVMFVVLLAVDRYFAMCKSHWCSRYRTYRIAISISIVAWALSIFAATPLYAFSEVVLLRYRFVDKVQKLCIAKWPSSESAKWYITFSSVLIFALPLALIVFCYYHIINKLREALKGSKRLRRTASSRAPYHRVTRLVLWVVVFHVICWSPFWLFNVFSSVFGLRISTQFDRIVINVLHLLPYFNCALNPLLYAAHAENFRTAIKSLFTRQAPRSPTDAEDSRMYGNGTIRSLKSKKSTWSRFSHQSQDVLLNNSIHRPNTTSHKDSAVTVRFSRAVTPIPLDTSSIAGFDPSYKSSLSSKSVEYLPTTSPSPTRKYFQYNHLTNESKPHSNGILPNLVNRLASSYRNHGNNNNHNNSNNSNSSTKAPLNKQTSVGMLLECEPIPNSMAHGKASMNSVAVTLNSDDGSFPEEDDLTLQKEEQNEKENEEVIPIEHKNSLPSFTLTNPDDVFC